MSWGTQSKFQKYLELFPGYAFTSFATGTGFDGARFRLVQANGAELEIGGFDKDFIVKAKAEAHEQKKNRAGALSIIVFRDFYVENDGLMQIVAKVNDEDISCGSLHIEKIESV